MGRFGWYISKIWPPLQASLSYFIWTWWFRGSPILLEDLSSLISPSSLSPQHHIHRQHHHHQSHLDHHHEHVLFSVLHLAATSGLLRPELVATIRPHILSQVDDNVMVMKMKALIVKALIVKALMMVMVLMLMPTTILLKSNHLQAPNTCAAFAGTGEIRNICRLSFFYPFMPTWT